MMTETESSAIEKLRAAWAARDAATTAQAESDEPWDDALAYQVEKASAALSAAVPDALEEADRMRARIVSLERTVSEQEANGFAIQRARKSLESVSEPLLLEYDE